MDVLPLCQKVANESWIVIEGQGCFTQCLSVCPRILVKYNVWWIINVGSQRYITPIRTVPVYQKIL